MVNKKFRVGMLVIVLVFGFIFTGCDELFEDNGYTFKFEVINDNHFAHADFGGGQIVKLEFINGDNPQAPVIRTEEVSLSSGQSATFKVSGFTEKGWRGNDYRAWAVRFIYVDGTRGGCTDSEKNNGEIRIWVQQQETFLF